MNYEDVLNMSYAYFHENRVCTPESIEEFIREMKSILDKLSISYHTIHADLERLHTVKMNDYSSILVSPGDHEPWFNSSTNQGLKRDIEWHFWDHYKKYLELEKHWPRAFVDSIDHDTGMILSRLEDPQRDSSWDRRGLVMGSVQSGKTANYTGLICKAIDAGYRLIIVLAGVHNSLRSQTQTRLNEEILGYDLDKVEEFKGQAEAIGVRYKFPNHKIVQTLTSSNEKGDFKKIVAKQSGIIPDKNGSPIIMVIKKNTTILKNIHDWATAIAGRRDQTGRKVVTDVPLLLIDDECDHASIDTSQTTFGVDGNVDGEYNPTKINSLIRGLLSSFNKSAYVGYTATPFANIFVKHDAMHDLFGRDLFPQNFILSLPEPENYFGPEQVFGLADNDQTSSDLLELTSLVKYVTDNEELIPSKHDKTLNIPALPKSLILAISSFLLSCAARRLRNSRPYHDSMLIHVTRYTDVQRHVQLLVSKEMTQIVNRLRNKNDKMLELKEIWEKDFIPISASIVKNNRFPVPTWKEVLESLYAVAKLIQVKCINGTSEDALRYRHKDMTTRQKFRNKEELNWEDCGEHVIVIGGDKLSRGLTLDGLSVSYYLRAAKMYDTLMQMGRWFGYRDGYEDLCRIFTTYELADWYRFIASASRELRDELKYMELIDAEPRNFGLKVLDHPGQLAITSAGKMRNAETVKLSYSGRISETIVFDLSQSRHNLDTSKRLMEAMERDVGEGIIDASGALLFKGISAEVVIEYLKNYQTQFDAARIVDPQKIAEFIRLQLEKNTGDLTEWCVALLSKNDPDQIMELGGKRFGCFERTPLRIINDSMLSINKLVDPVHEWIDFSNEEFEVAKQVWLKRLEEKGKPIPTKNERPSGLAIRATRPRERGLLLIYPIYSLGSDKGEYGTNQEEWVTGFAISFPASTTTYKVQYQVNSVYQDAEE